MPYNLIRTEESVQHEHSIELTIIIYTFIAVTLKNPFTEAVPFFDLSSDSAPLLVEYPHQDHSQIL